MIRKRWIIAIALFGILCGSIGYTYAQTTLSTFYIMGGKYPGAPTYTIWKDSTTYFAKDANGLIAYTSTNASYVINSCLSHAGKTLLTLASYTLTKGIKITAEVAALVGEVKGDDVSELKLDNGVDETVISSDTDYWSFYCADLFIDGNRANNAAGHGIDFTHLQGARFERVYPYECSGSGFYAEGNGAYFYHCTSSNNDGAGFYLKNNYGTAAYRCYTRNNTLSGYYITSNGTGTADMTFINCETDGEHGYSWDIRGTNTKRILISDTLALNCMKSGLYIGDYAALITVSGIFMSNDESGIEVNRGSLITFKGCIVTSNNYYGYYFYNSSTFITIMGGTVDSNSQTGAGTYDGIRISNSSYCEVNGVSVRGYDEWHNYGILEIGGLADNNLIIGARSADALDDKDIVKAGANTVIAHSWNGTTYIAP